VCCCFVCTQRTNISLRTRVFLINRKNGNFSHAKKKNVNNNTENNFAAKGSLVGGKTLLQQKQRFVVFREEPGRGRSRAASRFRIYRSVLFCISSEYFLTS